MQKYIHATIIGMQDTSIVMLARTCIHTYMLMRGVFKHFFFFICKTPSF